MTIPFSQAGASVVDTPFDLVTDRQPTRIARKAVTLSLCRRLEEQAANQTDPPIVLATFQDEKFFSNETARRYAVLARTCPLVAAIGIAMADKVAPGVRGVPLSADDPLIAQWTIVIVGAHFASAFIARDLGDSGRDRDRRFEYFITHDRETAIAAGRSLMTRLD